MDKDFKIMDLISSAAEELNRARTMAIELSNSLFDKKIDEERMGYLKYNYQRFETMHNIEMDYLHRLRQTLQLLSCLANECLDNKPDEEKKERK